MSDERQVLVDLAHMRGVALGTIKKFADSYSEASQDLSQYQGEAATAMGTLSGPWDTLCSDLQDAMAHISGSLSAAGASLESAVDDFADRDGISAKQLDKTYENSVDNGFVDPEYSRIYAPQTHDQETPLAPHAPEIPELLQPTDQPLILQPPNQPLIAEN